jgi:uncharacterized radical SAM superfamily protein
MLLNEKMQKALETKNNNFGNSIKFSYPNQTLAITTTGNKCSLRCAHCNGHYLKNMTPIECYEEKVKTRDITSLLLSGGCSFEGDVPINNHIEEIRDLKAKGYKLNAHLGLMDEEILSQLSKYLDVVSFDLILDEETIKEVYKIDKNRYDYMGAYETLRKYTKVIPHICIGLKGGEIKGEYEILEYLKENKPEQLTFIVLIPTKNTEYQDVKPPKLDRVIDLLCEARISFPDIPINLGCMRPRGNYRNELDELAIMCGINKIVLPTKNAVSKAIDMNMTIIDTKECCVL